MKIMNKNNAYSKPVIAGKLAIGKKELSDKTGTMLPAKTDGFVLKTENKLLEKTYTDIFGTQPKELLVRIQPQTKQGIAYTCVLRNGGTTYAETDGELFWGVESVNGALVRSQPQLLKQSVLDALANGETTVEQIIKDYAQEIKAFLPNSVTLANFRVQDMITARLSIMLMPTPTVSMDLQECYKIGMELLKKSGANSLLIQNHIVEFNSIGKGSANNFLQALKEMQDFGLTDDSYWYALLRCVPKKGVSAFANWWEVSVTPINPALLNERAKSYQFTDLNKEILLQAGDAPKLLE